MARQISLRAFVQKAREEVQRIGFLRQSCYTLNLYWRKLEYYAAIQKIFRYSPSIGMNFKIHLCGRNLIDSDLHLSNQEKHLRRSIRMLDCLYYNGEMLWHLHKDIRRFPPRHSRLTERFIGHRSTQIKPSSCRAEKRHLMHFLDFMARKSISLIGKLSPAHISEYCKVLAGYNNCTIHTYLCSLRAFLQFLYEFKFHAKDLSIFIPKFRLYRDAHIPSTWTPEEINRLLAAVDRAHPQGKRDYAMLTMVAVLGIRVGDLVALKLENLDWREKKIIYIQEKDGTHQSLPITEAVGFALIDYLKNGRPGTNCRNVFVRHRPPIGPFSSHNSYWTVFLSYMAKAGLSRKNRVGMHSLRHSLASHMLHVKTPMPVISNILGHAHFRTTNGYLRVAIDQLRQCCLSFGVSEGQA